MRSFAVGSVATLGAALWARPVTADLPSVVIQGSRFFLENGTEFLIRGVAYQQDVSPATLGSRTYADPLADEAGCARDIPLLQELGTNVIRVYAIDPSADHSVCMRMLQHAGIYLLQDLSNPSSSINRDMPSWDLKLLASYTAVVDSLANYSNVLGFFAGNEVSNKVNNTYASAFVKAAVRDVKAYIKKRNYRTIGVGYATNDDASIRTNLAHYFNCGDPADAIDFWGYNIYSWCGDSSYTLSGYDQRTAEYANYSIPAFFAEYGCNAAQARQFTEVQAIYGPNMTGVWSGGIVYMYFQEANDYGLVSVSGNSASKLPDFTALSKQLALATPSLASAAAYTPSNTVAQTCPTIGTDWAASSTLPPTPDAELCDCMLSALSCVANDGLSSEQTAALYSLICSIDRVACNAINTDAHEGYYGQFSPCGTYAKLSFAMHEYYRRQKQDPSACDFGGGSHIRQPSPLNSSCSALLNKVGFESIGPLSPTASPKPWHTKSTGAVLAPRSGVGLLQIGAYLLVAGLTGAALVFL